MWISLSAGRTIGMGVPAIIGEWLRERITQPVTRRMARVTGLTAGGVALLLFAGLASAASFEVGEKVFVPMFEPNPELDGYAEGFVEQVHDDGTLTLRINKVQTGKGKTLSGTCHPSGGTPLSGAAIVSDDPENLVVEQRLPADEVMTYRRGSQLYLKRENLSIAYLKYLGSGMGMTPDRFDVAIRRAEEVGLPRMVAAMEVGKMQVESTQGRGFPVPASRALQKAAPMLDEVAAKLEAYPESVERAARMLGGTTPEHRDDPLAAVIVRLHELLDEQLGELAQQSGDPREVSGFSVDELLAIYTGWFRVITANDTQPFQNAGVDFYRERAAKALGNGEWPALM
ncbi:hypothetical protein SR882_01680 [Guyparkeria halophila]|uniref:Uncharacterized protein n=1 Tax=Guyparkeria halophila TaxID=47960 RepID=A0ABZ0YWV4_9GAMM|nr:hypothetical protein [Guyparkeria halophila]WQH16634.1 hypothetical protein SR882_01680 [Guyparkeria halophila]